MTSTPIINYYYFVLNSVCACVYVISLSLCVVKMLRNHLCFSFCDGSVHGRLSNNNNHGKKCNHLFIHPPYKKWIYMKIKTRSVSLYLRYLCEWMEEKESRTWVGIPLFKVTPRLRELMILSQIWDIIVSDGSRRGRAIESKLSSLKWYSDENHFNIPLDKAMLDLSRYTHRHIPQSYLSLIFSCSIIFS